MGAATDGQVELVVAGAGVGHLQGDALGAESDDPLRTALGGRPDLAPEFARRLKNVLSSISTGPA